MYSERCAGRSERSNWRSSSVGAVFSASAALVAFGIGELNCEGEPRPWSTSPCTPCLRGVYSFEIYHGDTESTERTYASVVMLSPMTAGFGVRSFQPTVR